MSQRENIGKCYFCDEPVFVSEGQLLKYKQIGVEWQAEDYPVHKRCRKLAKKKRL